MRRGVGGVRRRPVDLAWVGGGIGGLLLTGSAVDGDTLSDLETELFRFFNDGPDFLYPVLWPLMQYGTFITIPLATVVALVLRRVRLAIEMAAAGVGVYLLAKVAKDLYPRGRPGAILAETHLRGVGRGEQGFPSGHAAVAAALAFVLFSYLPGRWRWVPIGLAVVVSIGRLYVGAHLPLDVLGGASLGIAAGALATLAGGVPGRGPASTTTAADTKVSRHEGDQTYGGDQIRR
jgi:membrane-associated phospholipid phosphatase